MRLYSFLLIIMILSGIGATAQTDNLLRVELNANLNMEEYKLVPCGENGILVFYESEKKGSMPDTRIWHFAFYDNQLKQQWLADTALIDGVKFMDYAHDEGKTYLFFLDNDKIRSSYNMQILHIDYNKDEFLLTNGLAPDKAKPVEFFVRGNNAIIALNDNKFEPRIMFQDLMVGGSKIIRPEVEGLNIIQSMRISDNNDMYVVLDNYLAKKQNAIIILRLGEDGTVKKIFRINPALENKVLNDARLAKYSKDTLIIMGTYHNYTSRMQDNMDEEGIESAGYFICRFVNDEEEFIKYYNFLEFDEMYRALSSKAIADLRRKAEKQKNRGEEYSLEYSLLVHDVIPFNGNFVLLSEAYYPEYRTVTNMYYDYYGRPIPQTYTVFDGYKYFSGIVAAFSSDGELIWDNGIEITDIITFNLTKYLSNFVSGDEVALFYSFENKVNYRIIDGKDSDAQTQKFRMGDLYKGDKLLEDLGSMMIHWYGNYFISYGYQKIRNNRISQNKRTIFYFSKLAFN